MKRSNVFQVCQKKIVQVISDYQNFEITKEQMLEEVYEAIEKCKTDFAEIKEKGLEPAGMTEDMSGLLDYHADIFGLVVEYMDGYTEGFEDKLIKILEDFEKEYIAEALKKVK